MIYVVVCAVVALGIVSFAAAIAGIRSYNDRNAAPSFENFMTGVSTTALSAAIIVCAVYCRLSAEACAVPVGFCLAGLLYIVVGCILLYRERKLGAE